MQLVSTPAPPPPPPPWECNAIAEVSGKAPLGAGRAPLGKVGIVDMT